jgi:ATP-dependent Clp protease ATP-binding subunit ClpC
MGKDIDKLFEEANDFYYKNEYENALKIYMEILESDNKHYQSFQKIAQIEQARGNLDEAASNYEKSLSINSEDANMWNDLGNLYFDLRNFTRAMECYKEAIKNDEEYYWAYYNVGLALLEEYKGDSDKRDEAKEWFEKAVNIKSNYHPALNELGLYYFDKQDYDKAQGFFEQSIEGYREYKYPYFNLAKIYRERQDYKKAKGFFYQAIQCDPNYTAALNDLGILFYDEEDYRTALYYYTRAIEINPKYKYALYNIGLVFDCMEKYKKSFQMHQRAIESDPDYKPAMDEKKRLEEEYADEIKNGEEVTDADLKPETYKADVTPIETLKLSHDRSSTMKDSLKNKDDVNTQEEFYVEKFGRNITKHARDGKLFEVIGRDTEIRSLLEVLFKIKKNNPILVGRAGVGKTAVVEGLAQKIVSGDVPDFFKDMEIVELNMGMLVAGTHYRGDFEKRLKRIMDELQEKENVILFIDEIHTMIGAGETEGSSLDAANMMKPALARGDLRCIGATTTDEYKKYFQKDAALERRFYKVDVDELDKDTTLEILKRLKKRMEDHYKIKIGDQQLQLIVNLADDEIKNRVFPDKALDIMEKSFSRCALDGLDAVDDMTIKNIIGEFIGVKFLDTEEDKGRHLLEMEKFLQERVYGQDPAIRTISSIIRLTKQKLDLKPYQPDGVFFFAGPTGVGKTYLAKQVTNFLFGSEDKLITLNMSEFTESHSVSKLIGSPPGYVGYNDVAIFSSKILENPSSVLLLDEVEKAHPEVLKLFLQIFDEGKIEDARGRDIHFSNVTIIMTSNAIGVSSSAGIGFSSENMGKGKADAKLAEIFPPEFVNRIDEVIIFNPIEKDVARQILTDLIMTRTVKVFAKRGMEIEFNDTFVDYIIERGYSRRFGVRNLERFFEKEILTAVSTFMFQNPEATVVSISVENGRVSVQ